MTVTASRESRKVVVNDGSFANPIDFDQLIESATHIKVYADQTLLSVGTHYSVAGVGDSAGIEITITATGLALNPDNWVVLHDPLMDQNADLGAGGGFGLPYENAIDALTRRMQALNERLSRTYQVPVDWPEGEALPNVDFSLTAELALQVAADALQVAADRVIVEGLADNLVVNYTFNWSGGNAANAPELAAPDYMKRTGLLLSTMVDDLATTPDPWPQIKTLLETDSSERDYLLSGAPLIWDNEYGPWPLLSRSSVGYVTMPQRLHMIMAHGATFDLTEADYTQFAPTFFQYIGAWGNPSRVPIGTDLAKGDDVIPLAAGQIAALGLKMGDDIHLRATEGLNDLAVGLFSGEDSADALLPATFSFYTDGATYAIGDGVIVRNQTGSLAQWNGFSMRCTVGHVAGAAITIANWTPTGLNAKTQRLTIAGLETGGATDLVHLTDKLKYNFPDTCKPIVCKYLTVGHHVVENFNVLGTDKGLLSRQGWVTATNYFDGEMLEGPDNRTYEVLVDHLSGVFATDLGDGKLRILPSDRLFLVERSDTFHIIGGGFGGFIDTAIQAYSVGDFKMQDHHGRASEIRKQPGGYLSLGGEMRKAMIDNCSIKAGSQPFMMSSRYYGIASNVTHRDCLALGGDDGFTQHHLHDGIRYIRCGHEGSIYVQSGAMTSFDIRTPSELIGCWSKNHPGTAVLLRNQAVGRNTPEHYGRGTVIEGFKAEEAHSGIVYESVALEDAIDRPAGPHNFLSVKNCELRRIGATSGAAPAGASSGGIYLDWTIDRTYDLPRVLMQGNLVEMVSSQHAVRAFGRWHLNVKGNTVTVAPDYVPAPGSWRSFYFSSNGGVAGEGPASVFFDKTNAFHPSFTVPFIEHALLNNNRGYSMLQSYAPGDIITVSKASVNFASIAGAFGAFENHVVTVPGARVGDAARAWIELATMGIHFVARVTADDEVTVAAINYSGGAIDLATATLWVEVTKKAALAL